MTELLFRFSDVKEQIKIWNEQVNNFFATNLDSPIFGYIIFFGVLMIAVVFINAFHNK